MSAPDAVLLIAFGLLGLVIGSFLNVVIHRLPRQLEHQWQAEAHSLLGLPLDAPPAPNVVFPGSHCPQCEQPLSWWHKVPVLSYLALRGRCAHCHAPIGWHYPAVELMNALWWILCALQFSGDALTALWWAGWGSVLLCLAWIDARTFLLPDALTLPLLWAALLWSTLAPEGLSASAALWGAALGYALLALPALLYHRVTGREGMAAGDFKLLAAIGASLGPWRLPSVLLLACLLGLLWAAVAHARQVRAGHARLSSDTPIPFGPALALAALMTQMGGLRALGLEWLP